MWSLIVTPLLVSLSIGAVADDSAIYVENPGDCLNESAISRRLEEVLVAHDAQRAVSVTVVRSRQQGGLLLLLRVLSSDGEILLERRFELHREDCASSGDLLATVLDAYFREFPREHWSVQATPTEDLSDPPRLEPIVVNLDMADLAGLAFLAVNSQWSPASLDFEVGLSIDMGSARHRLIGSVALRAAIPKALGYGDYLESAALLGVGWRYASEKALFRAEIRTGGILIAGLSYAQNGHTWLAALEGQVSTMFRWGGVMLGPQLSMSPLRHRIVASNGSESSVPWLRVGLGVGLPIWGEEI